MKRILSVLGLLTKEKDMAQILWKTLLWSLLFGGSLVGFSAAAASTITGDSVIGSGSTGFPSCTFNIDARSGPSGENPTGIVTFNLAIGSFTGDVTQLCVSGNKGIVSGPILSGSFMGYGYNLYVLDNGQLPTGTDQIRLELLYYGPPAGCPTFSMISPAGLVQGDIVVADSPPPPSDIQVEIDIKPGSFPNSINLKSDGVIAVAILGSASVDVTTIDPLSITLASAPVQLRRNGAPMASFEDVNSDGYVDLVIHVSTQDLQLSSSDTQAELKGMTYNGIGIVGTDTINITQ